MSKTGTKSKKSTDSAALAVNGPQPVWMTLNEARERAFTGEVVFEVEPEVLAYLDNGVVYYAERSADASLGRRLLDLGVIDAGQLERGTVKVGDVEHLGRLFDRDPSVDRDAVLVVAETATEELISALANEAITTVRVTAYRHHPSGVHRWFVAPMEPAVNPRPIGEVAQLDTTVVDDLPGLPVASTGDPADELTIEWEESLDGFEDLEPLPAIDEFDASMLEAMLDGDTDVDVEIIPDVPVDEITDWDQSAEALLEFTIEPDTGDVVQIDPEVREAQDLAESEMTPDVDELPEAEAELWTDFHDDLVQIDNEPVADAPDASLSEPEVVFEEIALEEVVLEEAALDDAVFEEAVFEEVVLEEDVFEEAVLEEAVLEEAVLEEVVLEEVALDEVVFEEVVLEAAAAPTVVDDEESVWEVDESDDLVDLEFQVFWPEDSARQPDVAAVSDPAAALAEVDEVVLDDDATESLDEIDLAEDEPSEVEDPAAAPISVTDDGFIFEMPPLTLGEDQGSNEDVPDDVADAVRRAIAAIESAAVETPSIAAIADPGPGDIDSPASGLGGFPPPSVDTSAEVLYSQWEDAAADATATAQSGEVADGQPSEVEDSGDDRSSALRRLIGSLRRKDR